MDRYGMTHTPRCSPLEYMTLRDVRIANESGACVVVLDPSLSDVLFANQAGRTLLGLSKTSDVGGESLTAGLPATRQIQAAGRILLTRGEARLLLRAVTGIGAKAVVADLTSSEGSQDGDGARFVLLVADRAPGTNVDDKALAERLLAESGLADAAIHGPEGLLVAGVEHRREGVETVSAAIAEFLASERNRVQFEAAGRRTSLARVSERLVLVRHETVAEAQAGMFEFEEPNEDADGAAMGAEGSAHPAPDPRAGRVSVQRRRLTTGRGATSMNALVERWHRRQGASEGTAPYRASTGETDLRNADEAEEAADSAPIDASAIEETGPAVPYATEAAARPRPMRSLWGAAVAPEVEVRDAPDGADETGHDDVTAATARTSEAGSSVAEHRQPETTLAATAEGVPAPDEPHPTDAPHALPGDDPAIVEDEPAQPFDKETIVILPDLSPEDAADLDVPISDDEEVPPEEAMVAEDETASDLRRWGTSVDTDHVSSDGAAGGEQAVSTDAPLQVAADAAPASAQAPSDRGPAAAFVPRFEGPPVRFVWQIDKDGQFRSLSADFAAAVGPKSADVIGRSFKSVAQVFGFDMGGEIARLLDRRDTWSGRSILWPVENSDRKVPVDLAALPIYARDRSFDGFRGFGIVKLNEAVLDEEAIGLVLANAKGDRGGAKDPPSLATSTVPGEDADEADGPAGGPIAEEEHGEPAASEAVAGAQTPLLRTFATDMPSIAFGRRIEPPSTQDDATIGERPNHDDTDLDEEQKVVRLEERRRPKDGTLSLAEEAAFRAIGMKLAAPSEAESSGALRFADTPQPAPAIAEPGKPTTNDVNASEAAVHAGAAGDPVVDTGASAPDAEPTAAEFAAIFGMLPLPVLVQAHHRLVYANREFHDLTGYGSVEDLESAGGLDALFVEGGSGLRDGEIAIRRSSGQILDMRVHMQRVAMAGRSCLLMSFSPSAREIAAVAAPSSPDLAATREADDLRQQVEELQAVLDTATDGVVLLDPAGMVRAMNGSAHALFGIGQNDHHGRHLSSLFAHESQKATVDYLEMLRDDGLAGILNDGREVIGRVAQGGFIPLFITIGRLTGERGWCVVIRDIAHWKRIEEDLVNARRQAEAASLHKSRFLANISHELRTPLNAIIGFADVMASECFGPIGNERYLEYLGDIKRSGHHVLDLVNDLLDISKIEAGKLDLTFEAVLLNEVVSEVVSLMQPQANRERVIVRSNLPSSVPPVVADRRTMRQIALNLVANAIRFTPAGGQIIASTTYTAEGDVLLRFRDSGIGMTDREIEIALTPFQQVHAPSANRGEGTGLGLPLTKAMVEANRAAFAIHSTPGEGTLVEISFPSQRVLAD